MTPLPSPASAPTPTATNVAAQMGNSGCLRNTPQAIIAKLNTELVNDLRLPDVTERITALGFEPVGSTPQEFGEFLKTELAKWAKVAKEAGATPD